ncbi:cation channel sperm-associated auxiliary subunit delta-like isoform X4 [Oncorhynchus nerka]|uniref:cation channel sperm-associated auxiliary subunit delta-like isoform X4 n=1 Tax=Oncorhynchus nerka TaxID=8023 RepID=UPI0031B7F471
MALFWVALWNQFKCPGRCRQRIRFRKVVFLVVMLVVLKAHIHWMPSWKACRNVEEHNHLHKGHVHSSAASGQLLLRHPQYVFLVEEVLFRPSSASSDLHISYYSITHYFCPLLVYHGTPWIPSMELWNGNELVEQASGDFVMFEVNGMHNYQYHQSGQEAKCVSQPKNWTSLLSQQQNKPNPNTAQTRNIRTATIR